MEKKYKISLEFTEPAFKRLDEINKLAGTTSNATTIRNALRVYDWFLQQKEKGNVVQVVDGNIINEISFIF